MSEYLPREVRDGLQEARLARKLSKSRVRVRSGAGEFRVLRHWADGFAVAVADAPRLRGRVDLYDGTRHLCQALIVTAREEAGEQVYEFKYTTPVADGPPSPDHAKEPDAPVALIPKVVTT
ncbi:MAG: hypothetical protein AAFR47_13560 [Pseudomonadota bacterium]